MEKRKSLKHESKEANQRAALQLANKKLAFEMPELVCWRISLERATAASLWASMRNSGARRFRSRAATSQLKSYSLF